MNPFLYGKSHSHFIKKILRKCAEERRRSRRIIIKVASKKSRFKAAIFSQLCLCLEAFTSELISHTNVWLQIFFVTYYENFFANANVSFRKLPTKFLRR